MNPLTGGRLGRRRRLGPVGMFFLLLLVLGGTGVIAVVGLDAGRALRGGVDDPTVVTAGLPSRAPAPPPDERASPAPTVALDAEHPVPVRLDRPPHAGFLFDLEKGKALWSHKPLEIRPIASLTKIMTALLVAERTSSRERVKITPASLRYSGSGVGVLPRGRRVPVDGLLHGMLLVSGNDAAIALADHVAGTERRFVALMNRRAQELGLRCTHFSSAYGLEKADRSCAADLAALARLAMKEPRIARIVRKRSAAVRFPITGGKLYLYSTNPLLRLRYPGTIGLKTGHTQRAGRTYVGVVRRRGRTLGLVLLDSPDPGVQAKQIFDRAFRKGKPRRSRGERRAARKRSR
jgi:serine-type D-Ala-D-Ala carboxypeptidase (penicillin-binding protein 5/6)